MVQSATNSRMTAAIPAVSLSSLVFVATIAMIVLAASNIFFVARFGGGRLDGAMKMERSTAQWWNERMAQQWKMSAIEQRWKWRWAQWRKDENERDSAKIKMSATAQQWRWRAQRHDEDGEHEGAIKIRVSSARATVGQGPKSFNKTAVVAKALEEYQKSRGQGHDVQDGE